LFPETSKLGSVKWKRTDCLFLPLVSQKENIIKFLVYNVGQRVPKNTLTWYYSLFTKYDPDINKGMHLMSALIGQLLKHYSMAMCRVKAVPVFDISLYDSMFCKKGSSVQTK